MCTDNDGAESFFLSTDGECSAPQAPLPWARGEANGDRRALVQSEKCAVLRHGGGTARCGSAAGVARALQGCPGRACMAFLFLLQEARRVDHTCTRFDPKTLDSLGQYIPSCRAKGGSCNRTPCHTMAALPPIPWLARRRKACSRVDRVSAMLARHRMLQH
jgi:hypothetical protein